MSTIVTILNMSFKIIFVLTLILPSVILTLTFVLKNIILVCSGIKNYAQVLSYDLVEEIESIDKPSEVFSKFEIVTNYLYNSVQEFAKEIKNIFINNRLDKKDPYFPTLKLTLKEGKVYLNKSNIEIKSKLDSKSRIEIIYLPNKPEKFVVYSFISLWLVPIILCIFTYSLLSIFFSLIL